MNAIPEKGMIPDDSVAVPRAARRAAGDSDGVRLSIELDDSEDDTGSARPGDPFPAADSQRESGQGGDQDLRGHRNDGTQQKKAPRQSAFADSDRQPADGDGRSTDRPSRAADGGGLVPPQLAGIEVTLSVEIGSHRLALRDLLAVEPGQLFALDRMTDEPVDILVNGRPFARGEVVAMGERFGVRLVELFDPGG